jgi:hypothetical protein
MVAFLSRNGVAGKKPARTEALGEGPGDRRFAQKVEVDRRA